MNNLGFLMGMSKNPQQIIQQMMNNSQAMQNPLIRNAIEMYQRGITFSNINLEKSMDVEFAVDKENNQIIPPFKVCDGIGGNASSSVIEARKNGPFVSKQDLKSRTKLNDTNLKLLDKLGVLKGLTETDQLTLF